MEEKLGSVKVWIQAVRAFAFPATLVPLCVGAVLAFSAGEDAAWGLFPLVVICSALFHAGTNVVCEYYDFEKQVDKDYTYGSSRVIVDGLLSPKAVLFGGLIMFAAGAGLGMVLVMFRGWPMLVIGIAGLSGGLFYSAKPVGYKYWAMGDIMVFVLMGPLMVAGSYFALTGNYESEVLLVSLPVGFLVAAILSANNLRDIKHDREAGVKTVANVLGHKGAKVEYYLLVGGAYAAVLIMILAKVLSPWSLIVVLSAPLAVRNIGMAWRSRAETAESIATLDVRTAQLHLAFGILLVVSILIGAVV